AWGATPAAATAPASRAGTAPVAPPRFETPAAVDEAIADADRVLRRAGATGDRALTDTAAGPARPASAGITRETTLDEAATRLAADLRSVPGIERFAGIRLADLERAGPRPLRTMWRIASGEIDERYGTLTIGELIERYEGAREG
ncbi:MAG: hypothetical protein H0V74_04245, partial [Chloroflexi bacterium]|nr:hypothetical protein [Chloroflexota bacterium]